MTHVATPVVSSAATSAVASSSALSSLILSGPLLEAGVDELWKAIQPAADALEMATLELADAQHAAPMIVPSTVLSSTEITTTPPVTPIPASLPSLPQWWCDTTVMSHMRLFADRYFVYDNWRSSSPNDVGIVAWARATPPLSQLFAAAMQAKHSDALVTILPLVIIFSRHDLPKELIPEYGGIRALVHILTHFTDDAPLLTLATRCICALSINDSNKSLVDQCDGLAALLHTVSHQLDHPMTKSSSSSSSSSSLSDWSADQLSAMEWSCAALSNLTVSDDNKLAVLAIGGITILLRAIRECQSPSVRTWAIACISQLAGHDDCERVISHQLHGHAIIINAMITSPSHTELQSWAATAIRNLTMDRHGRYCAMDAHIIDALQAAMDHNMMHAATLEWLCRVAINIAAQAELRHQITSSYMTYIIRAIQAHAHVASLTEWGCRALRNMCLRNPKGRALLIELKGIELLSDALQSRLTSHMNDDDDTQTWCIRILASLACDATSYPIFNRCNTFAIITATLTQLCDSDHATNVISIQRRHSMTETALRFLYVFGTHMDITTCDHMDITAITCVVPLARASVEPGVYDWTARAIMPYLIHDGARRALLAADIISVIASSILRMRASASVQYHCARVLHQLITCCSGSDHDHVISLLSSYHIAICDAAIATQHWHDGIPDVVIASQTLVQLLAKHLPVTTPSVTTTTATATAAPTAAAAPLVALVNV